jgi:cell division protein FtsB
MEQYNKLKRENEEQEKKIKKLHEKICEVDYLSGLVIK